MITSDKIDDSYKKSVADNMRYRDIIDMKNIK